MSDHLEETQVSICHIFCPEGMRVNVVLAHQYLEFQLLVHIIMQTEEGGFLVKFVADCSLLNCCGVERLHWSGFGICWVEKVSDREGSIHGGCHR